MEEELEEVCIWMQIQKCLEANHGSIYYKNETLYSIIMGMSINI
jgi:hypothetical protein